MRNRILTVGVRLQLSFASGRDILYGISRVARASCHWNLRQLPPSPDESADSNFDGLDGVITSEPLPAEFVRANPDLPIVVIGTREPWLGRRMNALTFVRNDDRDIGRYGAEYLMGLGRFRSFGFVSTNVPYYCSILRDEGFSAHLDKWAKACDRFGPSSARDGSPEDIAALGEWLAKLPKPAAVMSVHDLRATHVLEAAQLANIDVPRQLAVIGVDNDELLCDFTKPQLTSISPDHVHEGELVAEEMKRLLADRGHRHLPRTVRSKLKTIVERDSTAAITPAARLADEAVEFIRRNALSGIRARDVVRQLGVSRRLADLRYRECTGTSILDTILDVRLNEIKRRLKSSTAPIRKITAACGFTGEAHAKRIFKKRFGLSMRDYRHAESTCRSSSVIARTDASGTIGSLRPSGRVQTNFRSKAPAHPSSD